MTTAEATGRDLSGAEKAAIVLLELGTERSAQIMRLLGQSEVADVSAAIAKSGAISPSDAQQSFREFAQLAKSNDTVTIGGLSRARDLLEASVGSEKAAVILEELEARTAQSQFDFIARAEPRQIANFLAGEHPQTVAVVMAHLKPELSSQILSALEEDMRREASVRLARLERISGSVMEQITSVMERRFGGGNAERRASDRADGVQRLIDILNRSDRPTEKSIFEALENAEAELADSVRSRMFVFEDIIDLDDKSIQLVLRNVDNNLLATALKGVKPDVRSKITTNMSERAAQNLIEEIEVLGQVRLSDVQEAQGAVVQTIRGLEESGELVLTRGTEEFVS
ncbi:MAG: flagellar motor switch protein FliG [Actinomycetota bacterium]